MSELPHEFFVAVFAVVVVVVVFLWRFYAITNLVLSYKLS